MDLTVAWLIAALAVSGLPGSVTILDQVPEMPAVAESAVTRPAPARAEPADGLLLPSPGTPIWSMGQPSHLKWQFGVLASGDRGIGVLGVNRDLTNPVMGLFAIRLEGYLGAGVRGAEGGGRAFLVVPIARMHWGVDFDARTGRAEVVLGFSFNLRRGGVFGSGSALRVEWYRHQGQGLHVGFDVPIRQRAGDTRPGSDYARLPAAAPRTRRVDRLVDARRAFRAAADAVTTLVLPIHDGWGGDATRSLAADVAAANALDTPERVFERMVRAWDVVFESALAGQGEGVRLAPQAAPVAELARRTVLDCVLLPFDALFGSRRRPNSLRSFKRQATEAFGSGLSSVSSLDPVARAAAVEALAGVIDELDAVRARVQKRWGDQRKVFLPLQLALAPADHDTQEEIDALIERATGSRFSDGNRIWYVINEAFQFEFERSVRRARRFHVLWIHDFRGTSGRSQVDRVGLTQTIAYLDAMAERARDFDAVGSFPEYVILLDQFFYESNDGRRWMNLLERPLEAQVSLPAGSRAEEEALRRAQQALRAAVAGSRAIQAGRAQYGDGWVRDLVRVHINITSPVDWSFWASETMPLWGIPDNLFRDHRKLYFYDLSEDDPYEGEAVFTGMGIGEVYASAAWEDRALIVQGPAALGAKRAIRQFLRSQGATPAQIPAVFQERPLGPGYADRIEEEMQRAGAADRIPPARAMQAHNDVGFGSKPLSVAKAVLFTVMPPGSVLIVPDSLWGSQLYASLLAGSALRGCRVLVILAAAANSPSSAGLVRARAHMLASRTLSFSRGVASRLTASGGMLKVGLFSEQSDTADLAAGLREMEENRKAAGPWYQELSPFSDAAMHDRNARAETLARTPPSPGLAAAGITVPPKLHIKGLFIASREGWDGLFVQPEMADVLVEDLQQRFHQVTGDQRSEVDTRALPEAVWPIRRKLLAAHQASQAPEALARTIYYLQIGSFNMNSRSMLIDGEAVLTVSGAAALSGMQDFLGIVGLSAWAETQAQLDALIPPPSTWNRLWARWLHNLL